MIRDFKYLLISDSYHPEIRHVAKYLAGEDDSFVYVSGFVFTERKSLKRFKFRNNLFTFYSKREISLGKRGELVTAGKLADILFFAIYRNILKLPKAYFTSSLFLFRNAWTKAISRRAQSYIRGTPKIIISLGEWNISPREIDVLVTIMFHGNTKLELFWKDIAVTRWPDWADTWVIDKTEESKLNNTNQIEIHASTFTADMNSICGTSKELNQTKFVVPIAPITKNTRGKLSRSYAAPLHRKVLFLGSWTLRKGLPDLLSAFKVIPIEERPELHIAGSGKILDSRHLKDLEMESGVFLHQSPNSGQVEDLFNSVDILILPSYYEGFGIVILEAMSFGLIPIVSQNTAGPDIFGDTDLSEFVIRPGDIGAITRHLITLNTMSDADLRRLGKIAVRLAGDFDFDHYGKNVMSNIKNGLEQN